MIHAEMFRQLLNLAKTDGSIDANELTRIAILPNSNGCYTKGPQHELIAIRYRETIISFIQNTYEGWKNVTPNNCN